LVTFAVNTMRTLEIFENHFWEFYYSGKEKVREKIDYVLQMVVIREHIPVHFFRHLEDGIYEVRIKQGSDIYRIFCFFEAGNIIVLLHGIQKKTQKTPRREIERAKQLRKNYYDQKASKDI
jgi:phage-related protein